jgi:predicted  nucleic acid-binding Zn-ribbon protein
MTQFETLKNRANELKTKRDQALGAIKNIEDGWLQKYGTRDVKELQSKMKEMEKELNEVNSDYDAKLSEAEKILEGK